MEELRRRIGLRSYGQKDPLVEYKGEAYQFFEELMNNVRLQICTGLFRSASNLDVVREHARDPQPQRPPQGPETAARRRWRPPAARRRCGATAGRGRPPAEPEIQLPKVTIRRDTPKVGRNDPCPCGSGKKYKHCHGRVRRRGSRSVMIRIIGFDADDTLWHNENIFERAHEGYLHLLARHHPAAEVNHGAVCDRDAEPAALRLWHRGLHPEQRRGGHRAERGARSARRDIREIIATGREMLAHPVELLAGVADVVPALAISPAALHHQGRPAPPGAQGRRVGPGRPFSRGGNSRQRTASAYERVLRPRRGAGGIRHGRQLAEIRHPARAPARQGGGACALPHHVAA